MTFTERGREDDVLRSTIVTFSLGAETERQYFKLLLKLVIQVILHTRTVTIPFNIEQVIY